MEENNNPMFIIENQNEQNVDQILDINSSENIADYLSEQKRENEEPLNKEKIISIKSFEIEQSPEMMKPRGYVRILRKLFKKKDTIRKNRVQNLFKKWVQQTLKGLTIKKTIMVRISVSKDKDQKNKNRHKIVGKNDKDLINVKTNNYSQKCRNVNNIMREKIDDNEKNTLDRIIVVNKNNDKKYNIHDIPKYVKPVNDNKSRNISNIINNYNNLIPQRKNLNLIDISNDKKLKSPRISDVDKNKNKNLYPIINNLNMKFTEINNTSKNKNNNNNNTNINPNYNIYRRNDQKQIQIQNIPIKVQNSNQNQNPNIKFDNMSITYSTYTRKKNDKQNNNNTNNNFSTYTNYSQKANNDENAPKVFHMKYQGYHDNKNIFIPIPVKKIEVNKRDNYRDKSTDKSRDREKNIKKYNIGKPINKNSLHEGNKSDNDFIKKKVYQINNNINNNINNITRNDNKKNSYRTIDIESKRSSYRNNVIENNERINRILNNDNGRFKRIIDNDNDSGRYSRTIDSEINFISHRRNNNSNYSQITAPTLKGGVTTVIQHYSGRRRQLEQYDQNTFNRKKMKNKVY